MQGEDAEVTKAAQVHEHEAKRGGFDPRHPPAEGFLQQLDQQGSRLHCAMSGSGSGEETRSS